MTETVPFKYRAFLSYSHRDAAWGAWLHRALEAYRIEKDLVGRITPAGPVPKTLRPIFRDREDFSAGHSLTEQTRAALESSQFLIVLCSPNAAQSHYVNEEIRRFKALGRVNRVIPVIIEGEPGDIEHDCFPPALRFRPGENGALTDEREEPIAADGRPQGDGREIAKHKVVAGLLGVGLDEILRRAQRAQSRHVRLRNGIIAALLLLTAASAGAFAWARYELSRNEALLDRTLQRASGLVSKATSLSDQFGVPRKVSLGLLEEAETLFKDMAELGRETPQLRYRKAWMLIGFARDYKILGDSGKQRERAMEAHLLLAELATAQPTSLTYQRGLAVSHLEVGDVLVAHGDLSAAMQAYRASRDISEQLNAGNTGWQDDLSISLEKVGDVLVKQGHLPAALQMYRESLAIRKRLGKTESQTNEWKRSAAVSYSKIGDVLLAQANLPGALQAYRDSLELFEHRANAGQGSGEAQRDLAVGYQRVGIVLLAQGKLRDAMVAHQSNLSIAERLAKSDPTNARWQGDLSASYTNLGEVLEAQGDLTDALRAYRASIAIKQRLAKADPDSTEWQGGLVVAYNKAGYVLKAQGSVPEATEVYRESAAIAERLTRADPSNTQWQGDLSLCYENVGDLLAAQGNLTEALQEHRASLAIRERLAKAAPSDTWWQRDVSVSHEKIGDVLLAQGRLPDALQAYRISVSIAERLVETNPTSAGLQRDLSESYGKVGDALLAQKNQSESLQAYRHSLAIAQRLAEREPENVQWQIDSLSANWRLARNGDEPARRLSVVVETLVKLKTENKLTVEQANWLPTAQHELAKVQEEQSAAK